MNSAGETFPWGSQYHPREHVLQLTKDDLLALPSAIRGFNGFYTTRGPLILMNSVHILILSGVLVVVVLIGLVWLLIRYVRNGKRSNRLSAE